MKVTDNKNKFPYEWTLKDANFTKDKGTVFSCFACGGGSTMGYKLAGFDVLGCNEIDPKMIEAYKTNHNPKYDFLEPIQTFKLRKDLPKELYNLDILDGSPPCSSFSMAGSREKDWGKEKKFREGQAEQVLDTLFFDFIDLAKELQPKIVIAENVKGLLMGSAKQYVGEIGKAFDEAGYYVDKWLLDASKMGVPQRRERVFFVAIRKDLSDSIPGWTDMFNPMPKLDLEFNEKEIPFSEIQEETKREPLMKGHLKHWNNADHTGRAKAKSGNTFGFFYKANKNLVCATIISGGYYSIEDNPEILTDNEFSLVGSYPLDYNHLNNEAKYLIGMSVPPVMTAQISSRIYEQWLSKIN
ncbi:MAG: DNA cytosine methyltransferase [Candidatus Thorarchaeota archaeon]